MATRHCSRMLNDVCWLFTFVMAHLTPLKRMLPFANKEQERDLKQEHVYLHFCVIHDLHTERKYDFPRKKVLQREYNNRMQ